MTRAAAITRSSEAITPFDRVQWVDAAKGFGIILVVYGHVIIGLAESGVMPWTGWSRFLNGWIYAFHMPLFFFLSGLFLTRSLEKTWKTFISDKVRTLAYPYFVWSTATILIKSALGGMTNQPYGISDLSLILYHPIDQYWFLYALFFLSLTASGLLKLGLRPWLIFILAILVCPGVLPVSSYGWGVLALASMYAIYFAFGLVFGSGCDLQKISRVKNGWLCTVVAAGLLISSLGGISWLPDRDVFAPVLALSGTAAIVALAVLATKIDCDVAIRFLGRHSLEIYVAHTMGSAAVRIALLNIAHISAQVPHIVLGTLAGLCFPIVLKLAFDRLDFRFGFTFPKLGYQSNAIMSRVRGRRKSMSSQ